jgi:hypothetical protein
MKVAFFFFFIVGYPGILVYLNTESLWWGVGTSLVAFIYLLIFSLCSVAAKGDQYDGQVKSRP